MRTRSWRGRVRTAVVLTVALIGLGVAGRADAASAPIWVDEGIAPGDDSYATAIDDRGDVAGNWHPGICCRQPPHAFVRTAAGTFTKLDDATGSYPSSSAAAISRVGTVVGTLYQPHHSGAWPSVPFVWTAKTGLVALPPVDGLRYLLGVDVNTSGRVLVTTGEWYGGRVYVYDPSRQHYDRLPDLGAGAGAFAIDEAGDVAGTVLVGDVPHAVVWSAKGTLTDLYDTAVRADVALGINARGEVIGTSPAGSVYWRSVKSPPLTMGTGTFTDLNDRGCIVGWGAPDPDDPTSSTTTVWHEQQGVLLGAAVGAPEEFWPNAINNRGVVAGSLSQETGAKWVDRAAMIESGCSAP